MSKWWNSETGESFSSSSSSELGFNSPYNSRSGSSAGLPKLCKHGIASLRTSHTPLNPMRRFYCCSRRGSAEDCGLWEWVDPELNDHYKECISKLRNDMARAEELRDQATMAATLSSQRLESRLAVMNSAVVELDLLKARNETLEGIVRGLLFKIRTTKWVLCVVALLFALLWVLK
ncbi:uncharacterized protein LOC131019944 [Salvia miltiorrhiza]|uniref:uncharacterized protein LOC131019944 n=1 Tax=Salvia miltiorrhiza TaxID=226208 RepID=UPI0025AB60D6|nr:uncharacterized protein LOC131019944 [Salvia miltiorrhiza]